MAVRGREVTENLATLKTNTFIVLSLSQCKSWEKVRISNNFLNGSIPSGLFNRPLVTMIELSDNLLSGELRPYISSDLIRTLTLSNNLFIRKIPPAMGKLRSLQKLLLDVNHFVGAIPHEMFNLQMPTKVNIKLQQSQRSNSCFS